MIEIRHLKTIKNKRNLNTKWLLLQNNQNADTTLLHSHDDIFQRIQQDYYGRRCGTLLHSYYTGTYTEVTVLLL